MNYSTGVSGSQLIQNSSLKLQKTQILLSILSVSLIAYSIFRKNKKL